MAKRRMVLNAFECFGPTHHDRGMWRRPGASQLEYTSIERWKQVARTAERGKFDCVFIVDVVGFNDVYENSPRVAIEEDGSTRGDPVPLVAAMAAVTEKIGFGATVSTTYSNPYFFARTMNSLDHLSGGRIAWNIVTSYLTNGARDLGISDAMFQHDRRYDIGDEFMEVVYKLWEGSWEEGSVLRDQEAGVFADPSKIHPIDHRGEFFNVEGVFSCEPSPQRTPFLYQAGTSPAGRKFAARHAEGMFILGTTPEATRKKTDQLRADLVEAGRDPDSAKIVIMATVIVAPTDEEAQAKLAEYRSYASWRGGLAHMSSALGTDLSGYDLDAPLEELDAANVVAFAEFVKSMSPADQPLTLRETATIIAFNGHGPLIVGSPKTVADELERWMDVGGVDGFNLGRLAEPDMREDFVDLVVPELQARGRVWDDYPQGTMREKSFGRSAYLPDEHVGASYRTAFVGRHSAADERRA